jgi:hypothetical protein
VIEGEPDPPKTFKFFTNGFKKITSSCILRRTIISKSVFQSAVPYFAGLRQTQNLKEQNAPIYITHEPIWEEALLKIDNTREHFAVRHPFSQSRFIDYLFCALKQCGERD